MRRRAGTHTSYLIPATSYLLVLGLAVWALSRTGPAGAAAPAVSVAPPEVTVATARSVILGLQATAPAAGLGAWTIDVSYDPAVLNAAACFPPTAVTSVCNANYAAGTVRVAGVAPVGLTGTPTLASLTFTAAGAPGTSSLIRPTTVTFTDIHGDAVAATSSDGLVRVVAEAVAVAVGVGVEVQPVQISLAPAASGDVSLLATAPVAGLGAWTVDLQYDPAVVTPTACVGANGSVCNRAFSATTVRFAGASAGGLTGTPSLGTVTFQAVGAGGSSTVLHPVLVTFVDPASQLVAGSTTDGAVSITGRSLSFFETPPRAASGFPFGIAPQVDVRENGARVATSGVATLSLVGGPAGASLVCANDENAGALGIQRTFSGDLAEFAGCVINLRGDYRLAVSHSAGNITPLQSALFRVRLAGDADDSCQVDIVDFSILLLGFDTAPGHARWDPRGDFNGDDKSDIGDFSILRSRFATRCPP